MFLCLVRCLLPFFCRSSLLRVAVWRNFGSELLFWGVGVGLVFFGGVLLRLLLYDLVVGSRNCLKKFLDVRSCLFGFVLSSSGFFVDVAFVFFFFVPFQETKIR